MPTHKSAVATMPEHKPTTLQREETLEPEATTAHAITEEAPLPERIEILEDRTVIVGNGSLVRYKMGTIVEDPWLVANASEHNVPHRIATGKMPTAITILESKFLTINHGRGTMSVRAGEKISDPNLVAQLVANGVRYSDSSPGAA